jgi:hypothetical protein
MPETSCQFKTKFMKIDITVILEYPTYLIKCDFTRSILAKKGTYAHSKFNLVSFETYFS